MNGCNLIPDKFDINGRPRLGPHLGRAWSFLIPFILPFHFSPSSFLLLLLLLFLLSSFHRSSFFHPFAQNLPCTVAPALAILISRCKRVGTRLTSFFYGEGEIWAEISARTSSDSSLFLSVTYSLFPFLQSEIV